MDSASFRSYWLKVCSIREIMVDVCSYFISLWVLGRNTASLGLWLLIFVSFMCAEFKQLFYEISVIFQCYGFISRVKSIWDCSLQNVHCCIRVFSWTGSNSLHKGTCRLTRLIECGITFAWLPMISFLTNPYLTWYTCKHSNKMDNCSHILVERKIKLLWCKISSY